MTLATTTTHETTNASARRVSAEVDLTTTGIGTTGGNARSRLADEGVPVHELQMLAGHANITTTQRYMNARANSLAESMRQARQRRANRFAQQSDDNVQVG